MYIFLDTRYGRKLYTEKNLIFARFYFFIGTYAFLACADS